MDHLFFAKDDSSKRTKLFQLQKLPLTAILSDKKASELSTLKLLENDNDDHKNNNKNDNNNHKDHKLGNELNCHKSKSSAFVRKTLDQSADQRFSTTATMTKSFNSNNYDNRMDLRTEFDTKRNERFELIQGCCNCCCCCLNYSCYQKEYHLHNQQQPTVSAIVSTAVSTTVSATISTTISTTISATISTTVSKALSAIEPNNEIYDMVQLNDSLNSFDTIKSSSKLTDKSDLTKQQLNNDDNELNQVRLTKLVPVYQLVKQQVSIFNQKLKLFEPNELKCNFNHRTKCNRRLNPLFLLLMLFCLVSPLNAMTTFLSSGLKTKNQQTASTSNQTLNFDKNDKSNQPATSSSILTSNTFTSTYAGGDKNRAVVTTSPSKRRSYREPNSLTITNQTQSSTNSQLSDLVHLSHLIHQSTQQSHSLPFNFPISTSNHKLNHLKQSNESGIFFTNRSSNSLPILNKSVANLTNSHPITHSRIVITRNQLSKSDSKEQPKFKQLDASAILNDLNAQASISSSSVNKNNQDGDNQKDEKLTSFSKSSAESRLENIKRTAQLEANLPETFYQQTKKRMGTSNSPSALAQTRNLVISNFFKDAAVRPPSVSYSSSVTSTSQKSINNSSPQTVNNANKKQFTRITPNAGQLSSYSVSTSYSSNTSPTPIKRPLASSSTNKDTVVTKDAIITKDLLKDQTKEYKNTPTPDSVYVVHHHHLVSGSNAGSQQQQPNNERQQQQSVNRYTLISSTEPSSKSKNYYKTNYYKNEEEDDRVSTSSIFFDDEPSNLDKSNTLDLSMLLKKEYDEQSNNKIPREQLNSQYGTSNLNLFALLPTATTVTITPLTNTQSPVAYHHDQTRFKDVSSSSSFKDPSVFSTTVRSIKVDLNRQNTSANNRTKATITKVFGQRESLNDIWRTTNGHSRVPHTNSNNKEVLNNLTNTNVVDMKQFQLNLAKSVVRENPKDRSKNLAAIDLNNNKNNHNRNNTISTFTTQQPVLPTVSSSAKNHHHPDKQNPFKYINKNQLDDNKLMDNVLNSIDTNNLPNGLDALDSNQIYNRTMLMNDLKEYKERNLKKPASHNTTNDQTNDVLIRPVNDENDELLNNALAGSDSPSTRESYRLTTERLAYILIGSCVSISVVCLIIVAFSIRCRDMCDEYKQWKNAEKLALFNYRYQQHQQQQQRNHRLKLHQMAAFGGLVSESNSSSSQLISGSSGNAAVGALTNLSRPIFGPSCCCCPTTGATNANNDDKKHNGKPGDQANCPRGYFHNPCLIRGRLPFGAASSIARFTALNPLANNATQLNNDNNENSLELLDEENDTLNGSLTDEFTTKIKGTPHPTGGRGNVQASTSNAQGICLQCTCDDSFDEESDLGSLSQVPTAIKNASSNQQQQYLRPNQLINATHAKHFNSSTSNVNNHRHHHHLNNHHNNLNNNNNQTSKHNNKRSVFQPMESNWMQSSIVDELNRKHNHRLINGNQAKYEDYLKEQFCSIYSVPLTIFSSNCDRLI